MQADKTKTILLFDFTCMAVICGYYESIELNFMIPGHTKFKCDGSFGLIKRLYRKSTVDCVDHVAEVVKRSSIKGQRQNSTSAMVEMDFNTWTSADALKVYSPKAAWYAKVSAFSFYER